MLIGHETYKRRWVDYEIFKSIELGMGVLGIRIHQIADARIASNVMQGRDEIGPSPFDFLGYGRLKDDKLIPKIKYESGWKDAPYQDSITESYAPYLENTNRPVLSSLFAVYDWVDDDGYNNFSNWIEDAAEQAGR